MLTRIPFTRRWIIPLIETLLFVLIVVVFLLGRSWHSVQAGETPNQVLVPAGTGTFLCTIGGVSVFDDPPRIQVKCGVDKPRSFAAAGDSAHAITTNRFLTLLNTAYALGKQINVTFDTSAANMPPGCLSSDPCLKILGLTTVP